MWRGLCIARTTFTTARTYAASIGLIIVPPFTTTIGLTVWRGGCCAVVDSCPGETLSALISRHAFPTDRLLSRLERMRVSTDRMLEECRASV